MENGQRRGKGDSQVETGERASTKKFRRCLATSGTIQKRKGNATSEVSMRTFKMCPFALYSPAVVSLFPSTSGLVKDYNIVDTLIHHRFRVCLIALHVVSYPYHTPLSVCWDSRTIYWSIYGRTNRLRFCLQCQSLCSLADWFC